MTDTIIVVKGIAAWVSGQWQNVVGYLRNGKYAMGVVTTKEDGTDETIATEETLKLLTALIVNDKLKVDAGEIGIDTSTLAKDGTLQQLTALISNGKLKVDVGTVVTASPLIGKHHYTQTDIVNNKITIDLSLGAMKGVLIYNNSTSNTLTIAINDIPVTLAPQGDSRGRDVWRWDYEAFTEINVSGITPLFDLFVEG
ncbi:hypothetical protein [Methanobacterium sp.]|uniref:hypothetical protein n=1 Tax=Methanobacterium sp. TaxID=2164 RepID=UPI003C731687